MQTAQLIKQLEKLLENHAAKLSRISSAAAGEDSASADKPARKTAAKRSKSATEIELQPAEAETTEAV